MLIQDSAALESVVEIKPDEQVSPILATAAADVAAPSRLGEGNTIEHMYKSTRTAPE